MSTLINTRDQCKDCKYFDADKQPKGQGICRRRSPQVNVYVVPVRNPHTNQAELIPQVACNFPAVGGEGCWCGEFEQRILLARH